MNKVITDGLDLMPPAFSEGLEHWSSGTGTSGTPTYADNGQGVFVPSDSDFGGCLEIVSSGSTQKLRYFGKTPILAGAYWRITARVKAVSGPLPSVRIAGYALWPDSSHLGSVTEAGPSHPISSYGDVVEISAIVGTGPRQGVDLIWAKAGSGHFGVDIIGTGGSVVRVDDLRIEDVTNIFLRDMIGFVDVRDYGAVGDGVTDDAWAFEAADQDANGREVLVSNGTYLLQGNVTFQNRVHFAGQVIQSPEYRLIMQKNFDYAAYFDAFQDEEIAFKKAVQALMNFSDHESLDLNGRRIHLSGPVDVHAAVNNKDRFEVRRVIRNGQLEPLHGPSWDTRTVSATASYATSAPTRLSNVTNIAQIEVGMLVEGLGVGREVYVKEVNVTGKWLTLSCELYDAVGTQPYTFTRFQYMLDFTGFEKVSALELDNIDFSMEGVCSGILLATEGHSFRIRDCHFNKPKDRAITSPGKGCVGIDVFSCIFNSAEQSTPAQDRVSLCFNINKNDATIRNNRAARFKAFGVMGGTGNLITGNHWYMGDDEPNGLRQAGLIMTAQNCVSVISDNYIDNTFIELTNEHDCAPDAVNEFTFGGISINGNLFVVSNAADWFNWIVITPYGKDHSIQEMNVANNVFRSFGGTVQRVERIDTRFADINRATIKNVTFSENVFNGVSEPIRNPYSDVHTQDSLSENWIINTEGYLPFNGWTRTIEAITPQQRITNAASNTHDGQPYVDPVNGTNKDEFRVIWSEPVKGKIRFTVRMDNPA